jgi:tRNA1(Val) A37 N6-methylase TrmN6
MARHNLAQNEIAGEIVCADLRSLPVLLRKRSFQHVIANPPFFNRSKGSAASDTGREIGRGGDTSLSEWIDVATRRLAPKGYLTLIQRAERLPELIQSLDDRLGDLRILPVAARIGRDAELVIVSARKGARGVARVSAPFVLHEGLQHDIDRDSFTAAARSVLRDGKALV